MMLSKNEIVAFLVELMRYQVGFSHVSSSLLLNSLINKSETIQNSANMEIEFPRWRGRRLQVYKIVKLIFR